MRPRRSLRGQVLDDVDLEAQRGRARERPQALADARRAMIDDRYGHVRTEIDRARGRARHLSPPSDPGRRSDEQPRERERGALAAPSDERGLEHERTGERET